MTEIVFVVKASKFCNLRCLYCYEYRELGVRDRISRETLTRLFQAVDPFSARLKDLGTSPCYSFVWHGGEPLLLPPSFYAEVEQLQKAHIRHSSYRNAVQTNLTHGTEASLAWCGERKWQIGVSLDFAEDIRVTSKGKDSDEEVRKTAEELSRSGSAFGVVSVLGAHNRDVVVGAYDWIERHADAWRILPIFDGGPDAETARLKLSADEVVDVFMALMERRARADRHVRIDPLDGYMRSAVLRMSGDTPQLQVTRELIDNVYLVNVNGDLFTRPFAYDPDHCIGNVKDGGLFDLLDSKGFARCKQAIRRRKSENCVSCRYAGYCDSSPVHEHGAIALIDGRERCAVPRLTSEAVERALLGAGVDRRAIGTWAREWLVAA